MLDFASVGIPYILEASQSLWNPPSQVRGIAACGCTYIHLDFIQQASIPQTMRPGLTPQTRGPAPIPDNHIPLRPTAHAGYSLLSD